MPSLRESVGFFFGRVLFTPNDGVPNFMLVFQYHPINIDRVVGLVLMIIALHFVFSPLFSPEIIAILSFTLYI